jgi:hypothetical protein
MRCLEERNASEHVVKQELRIASVEVHGYSVTMFWLKVYNIVVHSSEGKDFKNLAKKNLPIPATETYPGSLGS